MNTSVNEIFEEIKGHFEIVPPFFKSAEKSPLVLRNLWNQTLYSYLQNPIPKLFKEKLSASIARFCKVPYCLVCHSSTLKALGMSGEQIFNFLQEPPLQFERMQKDIENLFHHPQLTSWPESDPNLEEAILFCSLTIYLDHDTEDCKQVLKSILPPELFDSLLLLIAYNRTCVLWSEAHPELNFNDDQRVKVNLASLLKEEPRLEMLFKNSSEQMGDHAKLKAYRLTKENKSLIASETELRNLAKKNACLVQSLLNSTTEGIWGVGRDGLITFVNPSGVKLFGYSSDQEMIGKNSHELVHYKKADGSHFSAGECPIVEALKKGRSHHSEDEIMWRRDGSAFFATYNLTPVIENNQITGAVITFTDTTDRKRVLEELKINKEWLDATLHGIGDAVIATDVSKIPKITFLNGIAEQLTGWSLKEARGRSIDEVFHIINDITRNKAVSPIQNVLSTGEIQALANHTSLISKSGKEYLIEDSASPIKNYKGEVEGVVLVFRDVTQQKMLERETLEANLRVKASQEELEAFFMQAPSPMVILEGPDHRVTLANPPYERLSGRKVVGKTMREAFTKGEADTFIPILDEVYKSGIAFVGQEMPIELRDEAGQEHHYWVDISYHPFRDPKGKVKGVLALIHDVTASALSRRKVEKSENRLKIERAKLEAIFYGADTPMVLFRGPELVYEMANNKYLDLIGQKDIIGKKIMDARPEIAQGDFVKILYEVYRTGKSAYVTEGHSPIRNLKTGIIEHRYFDTTFTRVCDDPTKPYLIVAHTMEATARVRDRMLLETAKKEADHANQTKSSFLANMSHEIRTPLGAIIGFTEMLRDDKISPEERKRFTDVISRNAKSLTRVIDDILDLSKVEAGRLDIELSLFSLREVLQDVIALFIDRARTIGIGLYLNIAPDLPEKIQSDPVRLRQIFINIIGNAIKFTEKGAVTVSVEMQSSGQNEKLFFVRVKDTGRGLTLEQQSKLFKPFSQADSTTTREYGGTGLGLVLSRRLANALGGTVAISDSVLGNGCTFVISFKAGLAPTLLSSSDVDSNLSADGNLLNDMRILLVEDSPDNQMLIRRILVRNGANVAMADNGSQGVHRALESEFDIVLMDIQMPMMDGYTAIKKLREKNYPVPIIALTAHAMEEERRKTKAAGFSAHVTKPIEFSELIDTILQVVGRRGVRGEASL